MILQAAAISMALSIDAFAASFAYGSNNIHIPMRSMQTINFICSGITGISLIAGSLLQPHFPHWLVLAISSGLLFILGIVKLLDSLTKSIIRRHASINKEISFSLFNFKFILNLYADPEKADVDGSKTLVPAEAASLAVALSLDGMAVGFGAALAGISPLAIFISSLITGLACLMLGSFLGRRLANKFGFNLSWIGGAILIAMSIVKLI